MSKLREELSVMYGEYMQLAKSDIGYDLKRAYVRKMEAIEVLIGLNNGVRDEVDVLAQSDLEQKLEPVEVDYEVNKIIADIVIINTGVETDKAMNPKKYHKVFDQWKKFNGMIIGKLNDLKIKSQASQSEENGLKRLYEWLMNESREPAQTKFTSGMLRNVAKEIEFRVSKREETQLDTSQKRNIFNECYSIGLKACVLKKGNALEISKLIHKECKDVPHDIGLKVMKLIESASQEEILSDMMKKDDELGLYDGGEKERGITNIKDCKHPREKRTYIGGNMLKCSVCGKEFN